MCVAGLAWSLALNPGFDDSARVVWMGVLGMQALPYAAAIACAVLSRVEGNVALAPRTGQSG
jgi:hypothetical protein